MHTFYALTDTNTDRQKDVHMKVVHYQKLRQPYLVSKQHPTQTYVVLVEIFFYPST